VANDRVVKKKLENCLLMKRVYIYPNVILKDKSLFNPYIDDLMTGLAKYFDIVNPEPTSKGMLDLFLKAGKADYLYLNWIENLPERKSGYFQTILFIIIVFWFKLSGKNIIWTMHNKFSHSKKRFKSKRFLTRFMVKHSDYVVTHSTEGVRFAESISVKASSKIKYFPHPVKDYHIKRKEAVEVDILIWGLIAPYKGIHLFLDLLYKKDMQNEFKILIAGKVVEEDYLKDILKYTNEVIKLENKFLSFEELSVLIPSSSIVIFPYQKDSILSSGVLMDTLANRGVVLGPNTAAFADLKEEGIIETYSDFEDMIVKIRSVISGEASINNNKLEAFIKDNSWEQFTLKIMSWIEN